MTPAQIREFRQSQQEKTMTQTQWLDDRNARARAGTPMSGNDARRFLAMCEKTKPAALARTLAHAIQTGNLTPEARAIYAERLEQITP